MTTRARKNADAAQKSANLANNHRPVTPSDVDTFAPSAIYVGSGGTVTAKDTQGFAATYDVIAGTTLPCLYTAILATGTTATGIIRVW